MVSWNWTALVKSKKKSGKSVFGTGFAVKQGWLLTARHVLDSDLEPRKVSVFWQHSLEVGFGSDHGIPVEEIIDHAELDVSLIRCAMPEDIEMLPFSRSPHVAGPFTTEGYPTGAKYSGKPHHLRVRGHVHEKDATDDSCQVDLGPDPENLDDWKGLSGGPVVLDSLGQAVGVFTHTRCVMGENRTAWAVPIHCTLSDSRFSAVLCGVAQAEPPSDEEIEAHRGLARRLVLDALGQLHHSDFASLFDIGDEDATDALTGNADLCATYCDRLLEACSNQSWSKILNIHRVLDDEYVERKSALLDLSTLIAAYSLDDRALNQVLFVRRDRDAADGFVVAEAANTMIGVELAASSIDGLAPDFEAGSDPSKIPFGSNALPFVTPEAGPDSSQDHQQVLKTLQTETGLSAIQSKNLLPSIDGFLANEKMLASKKLALGEVLDERSAKRLSLLLKRYRNNKKRSFYLTVVWPEDEALRESLRSQLQELKARYPSLLVLGLGTDDDAALGEEEHFESLISIIKDD